MKFTIRDLLLVTVIVALGLGWALERGKWVLEREKWALERGKVVRENQLLREVLQEEHQRAASNGHAERDWEARVAVLEKHLSESGWKVRHSLTGVHLTHGDTEITHSVANP